MNNGVFVWLLIFALSAICFQVIAVIVAVKGFGDLRDLLRHAKDRDKFDEDQTKVISE